MDTYDFIKILERVRKEIKEQGPRKAVDLINKEIDKIEEADS